MKKDMILVANNEMNGAARVLASVSDRLTYVGGKYDGNGWFLAAADTTLGTNAQNRVQVWLSENGAVDVYVGANVISTMTKASRDRVENNRTTYNSKQGFKRESKLAFRGDDALEKAYLFLDNIKFVKTVAKKSATGKKTA